MDLAASHFVTFDLWNLSLHSNYSGSNEIMLYDPAQNKSHKVEILAENPNTPSNHTACLYKDNQIIIFGGQGLSEQKEKFGSFGSVTLQGPSDEVAVIDLKNIERK